MQSQYIWNILYLITVRCLFKGLSYFHLFIIVLRFICSFVIDSFFLHRLAVKN